MSEKITKVRVDNFTAEHHGPDTTAPIARVDIWRDVEWIGQWHWVPEVGMGDIRTKTPRSKYADNMLGKIAAALRAKGV